LTLIIIGFTTLIAQVFLTKSLHYETAAKVTNVSYVSIVFSTIFGLLFWNEVPDWRTVFGAVLIIVAVIQIARE